MKDISTERFKLCDLVTTRFKDGKVVYKAIVYSTLIQSSIDVYITQPQFEQLLTMMDNSNCSEYFERVYNDYKKSFVIKFKE